MGLRQGARAFTSLKMMSLLVLSPLMGIIPTSVMASNDCQAATWAALKVRDTTDTSTPTTAVAATGTGGTITVRTMVPGELNCRLYGKTPSTVNYYTCTSMAELFHTDVDTFFSLNPKIDQDCSNIEPLTEYCVSGFIEPLRATDLLCGPANNNATCLGTDFQCCNGQTFTCGNSTADCADGTCYEGACLGDKVWSTDGTCGSQHGNRRCAGVQGDCCSLDGACGTGDAFCGVGNCQSGNCVESASNSTSGIPLLDLLGTSVNGTCGPATGETCGVLYGMCCNKDGMCGSYPSDCGEGCQPLYGSCSSQGTTATTSVISSTTIKSSATSTTSSTSRSSASSTVSSTTRGVTSTTATTSSTTQPPTTSIIGEADLPVCGQTCFNNMLAQYSALGCSSSTDAYCLCNNVDFSNGLRDCANGACGTATGSTVIAFGSAYCSTAFATHTATATGVAALPSCGQTCFNNMIAQYSALGCASSTDSYCLCNNVDFSNGLRDCSNGACGAAVGSSAIAYGSAYCATATATHKATATATGLAALPSCGQTCFNNMVGQYMDLGCSVPEPSCLCQNANFGYGLRDCANAACDAAGASSAISYGSSVCASATAAA